ncbi:FkbM family methyltransferase [Spirosoma knui]
MKGFIKKIAQYFGHDIVHLPADPTVREWLDLMRSANIDVIFDVGANTGQFGKLVRKLGFAAPIVSFEPLSEAYEQLQRTALAYPSWQTVHTAIGDYNGMAEINVSRNSYSSSLLNILPLHVESEANAVYVGTETVRVQTVDSIVDQYCRPHQNLYVKIDTQGFERQVIKGCVQSLDRIKGFQLELSLQPLYEQETLMPEMIYVLKQEGYALKLIQGGHRHYETGELLQVDGYFFR